MQRNRDEGLNGRVPDARCLSARTKVTQGGAKDAPTVEGHLRRPEAALFLHLVDRNGDLVVQGQDAAPSRDLQVHRGPVPLLPQGHTQMAELVEAQSVF